MACFANLLLQRGGRERNAGVHEAVLESDLLWSRLGNRAGNQARRPLSLPGGAMIALGVQGCSATPGRDWNRRGQAGVRQDTFSGRSGGRSRTMRRWNGIVRGATFLVMAFLGGMAGSWLLSPQAPAAGLVDLGDGRDKPGIAATGVGSDDVEGDFWQYRPYGEVMTWTNHSPSASHWWCHFRCRPGRSPDGDVWLSGLQNRRPLAACTEQRAGSRSGSLRSTRGRADPGRVHTPAEPESGPRVGREMGYTRIGVFPLLVYGRLGPIQRSVEVTS
jgi:hypothetical protein